MAAYGEVFMATVTLQRFAHLEPVDQAGLRPQGRAQGGCVSRS